MNEIPLTWNYRWRLGGICLNVETRISHEYACSQLFPRQIVLTTNSRRKIAEGGTGSLNVDTMHREIPEEILGAPEWKALGEALTSDARADLNLVWHRLHGWPDATDGLYALKKQRIISTLSNGIVRLLVYMAKHSDLPWDLIFSSELFGSFKPKLPFVIMLTNPEVYRGAAKHLSLEPHNCAMVAAHIYDLRAAASIGMRTIYIRRVGEESPDAGEVKSKAEGGEVDMVVDSFIDLAKLLAEGIPSNQKPHLASSYFSFTLFHRWDVSFFGGRLKEG
ncbi:HAD-like domain-containing protein [Mycena crocata]|nr:HAD-like domain-containing protein [Mycena crocata]